MNNFSLNVGYAGTYVCTLPTAGNECEVLITKKGSVYKWENDTWTRVDTTLEFLFLNTKKQKLLRVRLCNKDVFSHELKIDFLLDIITNKIYQRCKKEWAVVDELKLPQPRYFKPKHCQLEHCQSKSCQPKHDPLSNVPHTHGPISNVSNIHHYVIRFSTGFVIHGDEQVSLGDKLHIRPNIGGEFLEQVGNIGIVGHFGSTDDRVSNQFVAPLYNINPIPHYTLYAVHIHKDGFLTELSVNVHGLEVVNPTVAVYSLTVAVFHRNSTTSPLAKFIETPLKVTVSFDSTFTYWKGNAQGLLIPVNKGDEIFLVAYLNKDTIGESEIIFAFNAAVTYI